jgi:hypothetical protein
MKRRDFLKFLPLAAAAPAVAKGLLLPPPEIQKIPALPIAPSGLDILRAGVIPVWDISVDTGVVDVTTHEFGYREFAPSGRSDVAFSTDLTHDFMDDMGRLLNMQLKCGPGRFVRLAGYVTSVDVGRSMRSYDGLEQKVCVALDAPTAVQEHSFEDHLSLLLVDKESVFISGIGVVNDWAH